MKLLLTRPQTRIEPLRSQLMELGHDVVSCPLFGIRELPFLPFNVQDYDGLILTSLYTANDARRISLPIFAVGESVSAILPRAQIFSSIASLKKALIPHHRYLYLRGERVTDELEGVIHDARIVYKTEVLPQKIDASAWDTFEGVMLFSNYTSKLFEDLIQKDNLSTSHLEIFVLSPFIAHSLTLAYKKVHISSTPTLTGMFACLGAREGTNNP